MCMCMILLLFVYEHAFMHIHIVIFLQHITIMQVSDFTVEYPQGKV